MLLLTLEKSGLPSKVVTKMSLFKKLKAMPKRKEIKDMV